MEKLSPKIAVQKPVSLFKKPVKLDFSSFFRAIISGTGHAASGSWLEMGNDLADVVAAVGIETDPAELAFLLIQRSVVKSLVQLLGEHSTGLLFGASIDPAELIRSIDSVISIDSAEISREFLDRPGEIPLIRHIQLRMTEWLESFGDSPATAKAVSDRLPSYFTFVLVQEWRKNPSVYLPLSNALDTPFTKAGEREWAWTEYSASLVRRTHEPVFDEAFSLAQIYVPLNAYYLDKDCKDGEDGAHRKAVRVVVSLEKELDEWLMKSPQGDFIRVISGGPGSGKSSFMRIYAARVSSQSLKVLFVPLHHIDAKKDIVEEIDRLTRDEGILYSNPLDRDSQEPNLLIVFDGLDELASQGKAAAETAREFVRELEKLVERRNSQKTKLRVILSGRELVIQENESEFRKSRQVYTLLPYFVPDVSEGFELNREDFDDPSQILEIDLRDAWWKRYGILTNNPFDQLPGELKRQDLDEVTAQPLLNYLVALSYSRKSIDFSKDVNLNSIYADLVNAVHERGYETHAYGPIKHMRAEDFSRVLEEVGLAAWHGDGRTTTVSDIEEHCKSSGLDRLLRDFEEGAKSGVTRLLAAFFFRQHGQNSLGDPTFIFTHKSFGEYLTAKRIVRAIERVVKELNDRDLSPDDGWSTQEALKNWAEICGPSPMTSYLRDFVQNEINLRPIKQVKMWQSKLALLFAHCLRHGLQMELLHLSLFKDEVFYSRNAEEALLVSLDCCSTKTTVISKLGGVQPTDFGGWFKRVQGQRIGPAGVIAARSFSFLNLSGFHLDIGDFYNVKMQNCDLRHSMLSFSCFTHANLSRSDLRHARLGRGIFMYAFFVDCNLSKARLSYGIFQHAFFKGAILKGAVLHRAMLQEARFEEADLSKADLSYSDLRHAILDGANLAGANLSHALLDGASFFGADLTDANVSGIDPDILSRAIQTKRGDRDRLIRGRLPSPDE